MEQAKLCYKELKLEYEHDYNEGLPRNFKKHHGISMCETCA